MLPKNYVPNTTASGLSGLDTLNGANAIAVRSFWSWVAGVAGDVANAIGSAVGWVSKHPSTSGDIGCAVWDVFNFFVDFDATSCWKFAPPDYLLANNVTLPSAVEVAKKTLTKYDPICLSECNTCLEYNVPGYGDVYCLWNDYKGNWPSDLYCLQACPSGTTRTLLGEAEKQVECYDLCNCANGMVTCP